MAVTVSLYNSFKLQLLNGDLDLDADTIKVALLNNSASFTATNTVFSNVSANELANGNGYTTGGATLASKVVNNTGGTSTFDADDVTWTASGGAIGPAYKAVMYDTTVSNALMAFIDLGAATTAGDGAQFLLKWNASGIFTLTG